MLDENLPTFTFRPSSDNPLNTFVYYTYQGSEPTPEYLLKRPSPADSPNQYAFGLFDARAHALYAELLLRPDWTQPTLSAAELRAQNGVAPPATAVTPDGFTLDLYNPDQSVPVKQETRSWGRSDVWEFEMPERSFRQPTRSRIDSELDHDQQRRAADIAAPRAMFRWKRDGKLTRDMTCFMGGRNIGGRKSKEPDITVAMFRSGRHESRLTVYEPNMARVDVEDRKGLEVALLLSAEAIRDLYLMPRPNAFNTTGALPPDLRGNGPGPRRRSSPRQTSGPLANATMSGANAAPPPPPAGSSPPSAVADAEAEARRVQEQLAREERERRERRDREEQESIKRMLQEEERERRRRAAEVDAETERLRREYGVQSSTAAGGASASPAYDGGLQPPPQPPRRPTSAGPAPFARTRFADTPVVHEAGGSSSGGAGAAGHGRRKGSGPYALGSSAAATMSGFFGRGGEDDARDKKKKVKKKRSVHF